METLSHILNGFAVCLQPINIWYTFLGCFLGTVIGVLPGIGPSATMALLIPVTYGMNPTSALIMLCGIYYGARYGGSTTAILINSPGEASSVMTTLDGYAMAKNGRAGAALAIAAIASFIAGTLGVIGLTEAQACAQLAKVDIYKTSFRPMKMTLAGRDTRSFFKLIVDGETDRVVGCHIAGPDAGEMIQLIGIAVKMRATKADFDATMAVHPTAAEELVTLRQKAYSHARQAAE